MTSAEVLSTVRIALGIVIAAVGTMLFSSWTFTAVLFAFLFGVLADVIGGRVARGHETLRGSILDSLADKALVYGALLPFAMSGFPPFLLLQLLVARDVAAVALQGVAARRGQTWRVGSLSRLKTAFLYVACGAMLTLAALQSGLGPVTIDPGDLGTILPFLFLSQGALVVGLLLSFVTLIGHIAAMRSTEAT